MEKKFSILIVGTVIFGVVLGIAGISQAKPTGQLIRPIHATNVKIVKKTLLPPITGETKGKPSSPPGQDKKKESEGAATGILGETATGNKYAIVIGICDYPGTDHDLCDSDGDSLHMYKALTTLYGYDPANIRLFKDMGGTTGPILNNVNYTAPTQDNIFNAIEEIKGLVTSSDDEVVFFFSGHGGSGNADDDDTEDIDEAIVVHDSDGVMDDDGYSTLDFIWDGELKSWFNGFGTSRIVFVFDTCLAGGMNDVADTGRVVAMATEETKSAYVYSRAGEDVDGDGIYDGEGVFSRYFVNEGMLQNLADGYNQLKTTDNNVAVEEAFDYAKGSIPGRLKRKQKPVISDNFVNDLLL